VKSWKRERFAVVGFVPEGSGGLLKLRLARRAGRALVYVGRVGTGWGREAARDIRRALERFHYRWAMSGSRLTARYLSMSSAEASDEHRQAAVVVSLLADVSEPAGAVADGGAEGAPLDRAANFAFCDFMNSR
jgi:ATP-dependent DNA ligase